MRTGQTHMELAIHRCIKIRVSRHYPDINNAIAVEIMTEDSGIELTMYGLEQEDTDALMERFRDENTTVSHGHGPIDDRELEQQLNEELEGIGVVILGPGNAAA